MNFLPSKRFSLVLGACAVAALCVYGATFFGTKNASVILPTKTERSISVLHESPLVEEAAMQDTDQDGLKDWEERLWKTDADNKDTDGDKTSDGDEIILGRNPLVKGPNDSLKTVVSLAEAVSEESLSSLNTTERVARQFFVEYLSYKKNGRSLSTEEEQRLLLQTVTLAAEESKSASKYTEADFTVSPSNTPDALKRYGNMVGDTVRRHSFTTENELVLLERALENQSGEDLVAIARIAKAYELILKDLLAMSVPEEALPLHVFLTNQMSAVAESTAAFSDFSIDPLSTLIAITNYESRVRNFETALIDLQSFFLTNNIAFSESDPGYLLMQTGNTL